MPRFFTLNDKTLHIADRKDDIPEEVINNGNEINENIEVFAKLRRTMVLFDLSGPLKKYFSKDDFCIYSGCYNLNHPTNEDLVQVEQCITYK